jgi:hypothetical protein
MMAVLCYIGLICAASVFTLGLGLLFRGSRDDR